MPNVIKKPLKKGEASQVKLLHEVAIPTKKKKKCALEKNKNKTVLRVKKTRKPTTRKKIKTEVDDSQIIQGDCIPLAPSPPTQLLKIKLEPDQDVLELPTMCSVEYDKKSAEYEKPPQMLLPYTYFINDCKYISIGFSTPDIVPVIVIHHIGECSIVLCAAEWFSLFLYVAEIEDMFHNSLFMETKYLSNTATIVHDVILGQIIMIKDKVVLKLTKTEWTNIVHMSDFVRSVINFFTQSVQSVKLYYDTYMKLCKENNFTHLDTINFFLPANDSKLCNYTRLFHEIGFICKKNTRNHL